MASTMKIKLVPLLEWIQVRGHGNRTDMVAIYNANVGENENVYFEKRGVDVWSPLPSEVFETDVENDNEGFIGVPLSSNSVMRDVPCVLETHTENNVGECLDVTNSNKQSSEMNSCQTDCFPGFTADAEESKIITPPGSDNVDLDFKGESGYGIVGDNLGESSILPAQPGIESMGQKAICCHTETVTDICSPKHIRSVDGSNSRISDKNEDRKALISSHSFFQSASMHYLHSTERGGCRVTQTGNRKRYGQNLQCNNRNSGSCGESGGKSWFEGWRGCKHKHPAVRTTSAPGKGRDAIDGRCSRSDNEQVDLYPLYCDSNHGSGSFTLEPADGDVKFLSAQKCVVKYNNSLEWKVCAANAFDMNSLRKSATDIIADEQVQKNKYSSACLDSDNSSSAVTAGEMLPCSCTCNRKAAYKGVACFAYNSTETDNCNKLTDQSADDSAVGRSSLVEDGKVGKNIHTQRPDVKGAITENNSKLKSPRCPCCLISPDGPLLENEFVAPEPCELQFGLEPNSYTDMVDNIVKWQIYKAEASKTGLPLSCGPSNIRSGYNGNSRSCDEENGEAEITRKRVFFSSDDQLLSGVEREGMPHVGDTVDSQNSCYGIRRPGAAARVPPNTNAKVSIEKTAESLLQLQVERGKTKLSPETSVPVQTHSEGSRGTSSPISSDVPNSASAGQSYAAVLRANIKVGDHTVHAKSSCPVSKTRNNLTGTGHQCLGSRETPKGISAGVTRGVGKMGNQNSSGVSGDRSKTPILGRRKSSSQGAASTFLPRSVPVTPAGTPASIRSEKVGFFRKFRRNKNRSRSGSMASINSVSSCASTASYGLPSKNNEDTLSKESQSSLTTSSEDGPLHVMPGSAPSSLNTATPTGGVNVPALPHNLKQQATILQPISERPNETYLPHTCYLHSDQSTKNEKDVAEKDPYGHSSLGLLKQSEGTTGSNLTLTDDGSEYLTASDTDLNKASSGGTGGSTQVFDCDHYKVTRGTLSQSAVSVGDATNKTEIAGEKGFHRDIYSVRSSVDGARSSADTGTLHAKSADSLVPNQISYHTQHTSRGANTLPASTKLKKSDAKYWKSKTKSGKSSTAEKSKTYAAVLGTGLFFANLSDTVPKESASLPTPDTVDPTGAAPKYVSPPRSDNCDNHSDMSFPSQPAAPVCQVEGPEFSCENITSTSLPKSFADAVSSQSSRQRIVQPPRGPFGSLTRKNSKSSGTETVSEPDQMPLAPGLHGKLPVAVSSKQGIRTSQKLVNEPIVQPQIVASVSQSVSSHGDVSKNIRPRTFLSAVGLGGGKSQIGVKTVPRGNAGSPATTPDGSGVTCHSLPRSSLSSAGSAPALGVCGARLRAAKAHSVQQLNATRSPPTSPTRPPENSPFAPTSFSAKSMPQLAGKIASSKDNQSSDIAKVRSDGSVNVVRTETSSLPRLPQRSKIAVASKSSVQLNKSKISGTSPVKLDEDCKSNTNSLSSGVSSNRSALVINVANKRTDELNPIDETGTTASDVSDVKERISGRISPSHRLNTHSKDKSAAKSDQLAKCGIVPATQTPHEDRETAVKSVHEVSATATVDTKKGCQPRQSVTSSTEAKISIESRERGSPATGNAEQRKLPGCKTTVKSTSKLPASFPSEHKLDTGHVKSNESVSNQHQTKQSQGNTNIVRGETTETVTNNLQEKHINLLMGKDIIRKSTSESTSTLHSESAKGHCVLQPGTDESARSVCSNSNSDNLSKATTEDGSFRSLNLTSDVHTLESGVISTDPENKSDNVPQDHIQFTSEKKCAVGSVANTASNRPLPELRDDHIIDEGKLQKEILTASDLGGESHSSERASFVTNHPDSVPKTADTSQPGKLTIDENLEQKCASVNIEKPPTETLVLRAKLSTGSEHLEANNENVSCGNDDQLKCSDVKNDEINSTEMGLGESKYEQDGGKKVTASKLSASKRQRRKSEGTKVIGVSDLSRSSEKVGPISPDNSAVKDSQLAVKAESQCEAEALKLNRREDRKICDEESETTGEPSGQHNSGAPRPPPRTQKIVHIGKHPEVAGQKVPEDAEPLSASPHQANILGKNGEAFIKKKMCTETRYQHPKVQPATDNSVSLTDESDKTTMSIEKSKVTKSVQLSEVRDQNLRTSSEMGKQSTVGSVDISRTPIGFTGTCSTAAQLQETKQTITDTSSPKHLAMDGRNRVQCSDSITGEILMIKACAQFEEGIDIKADSRTRIREVTENRATKSEQEDKQDKVVDKYAVNKAECNDMQVSPADNNQEDQSFTTNNAPYERKTEESGRTSGSKPMIFDEMISVKDVTVSSESSSAYTSLEIDEKTQSDVHIARNQTTPLELTILQIEPTGKGVSPTQSESEAGGKSGRKAVPKVKISIEQIENATDEVHACVLSTKPKIITEEEVTFTIDIPAGCARVGRPLPEVNVYVSATCVAVTSTSGTINTTSQLGRNETTTSVSDDGQALMSVRSGADLPLACVSTGGEALSSHQKDETSVNICADGATSSVEVVEGSAEVKRAGQEKAGSSDAATRVVGEAASNAAGIDADAHTMQSESVPTIVVNEPGSDKGNELNQCSAEIKRSQITVMQSKTDNNADSFTLINSMTDLRKTGEIQVAQHMDAISSKAEANVPFGSHEEQSASVSGGKQSDKSSSNEKERFGSAGQHAGAADPISISKPPESEQAHSTVIASGEGSGCDPGNIRLTVEEIGVCEGGTDTASINTAPQIAIAPEFANKDSVVESTPAESNVNNAGTANITNFLTVDDHPGHRGAESDTSSIGKLIYSSEGEHSDINFDDIVVRNMEECNIKVETMTSDSSGSASSSDSDSDDESSRSSPRESESEEENNKITSDRRDSDKVNDSDLSDFCEKLKIDKKIENVEETTTGDESSESEDEKPKKCITDEEIHGKARSDVEAKSAEDCFATKLENMGHKVGEAYFVTRKRKRAKMVDRETITMGTHEVQCPEVCHVSTDTFDSILISSSGSSDTSPSRVQWEDDSVDELDAPLYDYYSDEEEGVWYEDYSDDSVYSDEDSQLGATAAGPVKVIYSRPRLDSPRGPPRGGLRF